MCKLCMIIYFFCLTNLNYAQVIGEIFDKEIADQKFGNVISYLEIKSTDMDSMLQISGEYIMFNADSGKIRVIDSERNSIMGYAISEEEVFYNFSSSKVDELLVKGQKKMTSFEMRTKTLTLTNGDFTLEMSLPCPPFCGN